MTQLLKLIAVAIGAALMACLWTPPRSAALEEARRAFKLASDDPLVLRSAAGELRNAQLDLRRAERSWVETHDEALTSHYAYLAFQRVALARNVSLQHEAEQRLRRAQPDGSDLLAPEPAREARSEAPHPLPVNLQPAAPAREAAEAQPAAPALPAVVGAAAATPQAQAPAAASARPMAARPAPNTLRRPALRAEAHAGRGTRPHRLATRHAPPRVAAARSPKGSLCRAVPDKPEVWSIEAQGRPAGFRAPCLGGRPTAVAELTTRLAARR